MKNLRKSKQTKTNVDLSKPFDLPVVDRDCFGKLYDITAPECGVCHDNIAVSYTHLDVYKRQP